MLSFDPRQAVGFVAEAAELALRLHGQARVETKPDHTLVTEADRRIEDMLKARLNSIAPEYAFLGEETGLTGSPDAPCWVIDPIDGTTNFVRGLPIWCVSVGAVYEGRCIFGAIAVPPLAELYWAEEGQGAWLETAEAEPRRLRVTDELPLMQEDLVSCNTTVEEIVDFTGVPCRLRNFGAIAYHFAAMAGGSFAAALAHHHKLYDIAGGMCICQEAGCEVHYLDRSPWQAVVHSEKEQMPLLVAPPRRAAYFLEQLKLKEGFVSRW